MLEGLKESTPELSERIVALRLLEGVGEEGSVGEGGDRWAGAILLQWSCELIER